MRTSASDPGPETEDADARGDAKQALLSVRELTAGYGPVTVVRRVSLQIYEGEFVCILGANGVGKTTFLRALVGDANISAGNVLLDGEDVARKPSHHITGLGLAVVPEGRALVPDLTVRENLLLGTVNWNRRYRSPLIDEALAEIYERFPVLGNRSRQLAGSLSGGEQQMLAIGRALLTRPRLLVLDEPSLDLAPIILRLVFDHLAAANMEGLTVLVAEQNASAALRVADRAVVMSGGRIVRHGDADEIAASDELRSAFLGANSTQP